MTDGRAVITAEVKLGCSVVSNTPQIAAMPKFFSKPVLHCKMLTKALAWFSLVVSKYLFLGELYWEDTELMLPNALFLECAWQAHTLREELADAVGAGEMHLL